MTKSNNEWVPETFDEVEVWIDNVGYWAKVKVLAVDCGRVVWRNGSDGLSYIGTPLEFVRPIKSESDKLRDEQISEMLDLDPFLPNTKTGMLSRTDFCKTLYDNGFRKPRPLTDDAIRQAAIDAGLWGDRPYKLFVFAKEIAAYVRGDSATGE